MASNAKLTWDLSANNNSVIIKLKAFSCTLLKANHIKEGFRNLRSYSGRVSGFSIKIKASRGRSNMHINYICCDEVLLLALGEFGVNQLIKLKSQLIISKKASMCNSCE
jgi:hypothetical protein